MLKDKLAYCVIDTDTMEIESKFYKRKRQARSYINVYNRKYTWLKKRNFAIAEFEYKQHYVLED